MEEILDRIKAKSAERDYCLDVLLCWDVAKRAGFEPDVVQAFSFREEFLTFEQKRTNRKQRNLRLPLPFNGKQYHNCVRLKDGTLKAIPLVLRPGPDPAKNSL